MNEGDRFSGVTHYTHVDVQPGGINIQHVEHLHQADILQALGIELEVKQKSRQQEEVTATAQSETEEPAQELNYFAPTKNLQELLKKDWFDSLSTDQGKYTQEWRKELVAALMDSEFKDEIATLWAKKDKTLWVKCTFVGALKDAKVIKGSYTQIAKMLELGEDKPAETLARYMGEGKNQPYYDWLVEYVES